MSRTVLVAWPVALLAASLALLGAGCQAPAGGPPAQGFEFALLGDNPYNETNLRKYRRLIEHVNGHPGLAWVLHLGDLKGGQSCADDELRFRFELNQGFRAPFVLTPGDNDWYDCVRDAMGGFDDFERLAALRRIFYPVPGRTSGTPTLEVRTQADGGRFPSFVENVIWQRDGVVFAAVHVIGPTRPATDPQAFTELTAAWVEWIGQAFDEAEASGARAVFLAMQADPWLFSGLPELVAQFCPTCPQLRPGLERLYPLLVERSRAFGGPVVVAVGDSHVFRVDKPLYAEDGTLVENLTRVEAFGHPYVHWVRVEVHPDQPQVFSFHQELVPDNIGHVVAEE
jgi:hypothetical protein